MSAKNNGLGSRLGSRGSRLGSLGSWLGSLGARLGSPGSRLGSLGSQLGSLSKHSSGEEDVREEELAERQHRGAGSDFRRRIAAQRSATSLNSQHFKSRVSNPRTIAYFHSNMPFESSNLPGAGPNLPDCTFENWR